VTICNDTVTAVTTRSEQTWNIDDTLRSTKMTRSIATTLIIPLDIHRMMTDFILATSNDCSDMYLLSKQQLLVTPMNCCETITC